MLRKPRDNFHRARKRRNGNEVLYCSAACGSRCLWRDYLEAKRSAPRLAKRLGKGWRGRVWEDHGWRWAAYRPGIVVYGPADAGGLGDMYTAIISPDNDRHYRWSGYARRPEKAIKMAAAAARGTRAWLGGTLERLGVKP